MNGWEDGAGSPGGDERPPLQPHPSGGIPMDWSSGRRAADHREDDDAPEWVGALLRMEAARHEPDRDRILSLMAARDRDEYDAPATVSSLDARRRERARQESRLRGRRVGRLGLRRRGADGAASGGGRVAWPLVAASFAVLTMATVAGARAFAPAEGGAGTVTATADATPTPTSSVLAPPVTIDGTPTGAAPSTPAPSTTAPSSRDTSPSTSGPAPDPGGRAPAATLREVTWIGITPTGDGTQLSLPRSAGERDWIAVGSRQDGRLVRKKDPRVALGDVTVSGYGPSIVQGPYRISWTGGTPEQDRPLDTMWQSITAVDGRLRITAPLHGDRMTIDLFAGTVKTTGLVRVFVAGSSDVVSQTIEPCAVDICPTVVTVHVDASRLPGGGTSGDLVIDLGPARPGVGLGLGLAAVVLR